MMSLVVMSQMFLQERFLLGKFHSGKAVQNFGLLDVHQLFRQTSNWFVWGNTGFNPGKCLMSGVFFAVILCCTKHHSLISLILILGQMKIEGLPWLLPLCSLKNNVEPSYLSFESAKNLGKKILSDLKLSFFGGYINDHHIDIWRCPINKNRGPTPTRSTRKSCSTSPFSGALWGPRLWWCRQIGRWQGLPQIFSCEGNINHSCEGNVKEKTRYKNGLKYHLGEGCLLCVEDVLGICVVNMCMYLIIRIYTASCIFPSAFHKYHQISTFKESSIVLIDFYSFLYHSVMCDLFFI